MKRNKFFILAIMASFSLAMAAIAASAELVADTANRPNAAVSGMDSPSASVLDKFRTYSGPRSPEKLSALFSGGSAEQIRQQPLIALSDGNTALLVSIRVDSSDDSAPGFAIKGGKLVSLQRQQNNEWLLKAMPDKGALSVSLSISTKSGAVDYPLTVAPQLPPDTDLSEQGFVTFLANHQTTLPGRRNFVDDYIFTANYLTKQSTTGSSQEARRQRALKRTLSAPNSIPSQPAPAKDYEGVIYGDL